MSAKAVPFRDLGKNANDLLSKGFPTTFKVEVTTAQEGLTFVSAVEKKRGKKATDADFVFGSVQPKFKNDKYGFEFNGTLDTAGAAKGDFIFKDLLSIKGLKTTLKTQVAGTQTADFALEYALPSLNLGSNLVWKAEAPLAVSASAVAATNDISAGFHSSYRFASESSEAFLDKIEAAANFKKQAFDITAFVRNEKTLSGATDKGVEDKWTVSGSAHYSVDKNTAFAVTADHDLSKSIVEGLNVRFGGSFNYGRFALKAKADTKGIVALSVSENLSPSVNYTLGSEIDTNNLAGNAHKFGLSLTVKPKKKK
ncbi:Mitochondrial porin [Balamuthia mandrillaris]